MPPTHILNAPTKLMKDIGYGKGYAYDHDADEGFSGQDYWPEEMEPQTFYEPTDRGFEARVRERLEYWERAAQRAATKRRRRGLSRRAEQGASGMYRSTERLLAGPADVLGPKVLIAILILVATWIVARAVKWVLQKAIDRTPALQQARHRHARGDRRPPARHDRQADHLAGRNHGRAAVPRVGQILAPINALVTRSSPSCRA